jgi:hypothetical protein
MYACMADACLDIHSIGAGAAFVMAIHTGARRCHEVSEAHKCDAAITEGAVSRRTFSGTTFPFFRAAHRWGVGWGRRVLLSVTSAKATHTNEAEHIEESCVRVVRVRAHSAIGAHMLCMSSSGSITHCSQPPGAMMRCPWWQQSAGWEGLKRASSTTE